MATVQFAISGIWTSGGGVAGTVYEKVGAVVVPVFEVVNVVFGMSDVDVDVLVGGAGAGVVVPVVLVLVLVAMFVTVVGSVLLQADNRERVVTNAPPVVIPKRCRNCRLENLGTPFPSASIRVSRAFFPGILCLLDRPTCRYRNQSVVIASCWSISLLGLEFSLQE